jgi:site-specific recombinase XerD
MTANKKLVAPWVRRFLLEHLVGDLNLSRNTQASYRDTLTLLLPHAAKQLGQAVDQLEVEDLSPDVVRRFLIHVEDERQCSTSTRNQRLAAIHAFARFIGARSPEHLAWCAQLTSIPFKRTAKGTLPYLEKPELDAILAVPDRRTRQGARDHALLLFLYNAGARADETARLTVADLDLGPVPAVTILGKGKKARLCPLWASTASALNTLVAGRSGQEPVFLNRRRQGMTRFGSTPSSSAARFRRRVAFPRSAPSVSARTSSDTRLPSTCCGRASTSTPSVPGSGTSPSTPPTSTPRSILR